MNHIPKELQDKYQWLVFKKIPRQKPYGIIKKSKIPYSASTLSSIGCNKKENFSCFDKAFSVLVDHHFYGLSFVLTKDDPYVCIDLYDCIDHKGHLSTLACNMIETFEGSPALKKAFTLS